MAKWEWLMFLTILSAIIIAIVAGNKSTTEVRDDRIISLTKRTPRSPKRFRRSKKAK